MKRLELRRLALTLSVALVLSLTLSLSSRAQSPPPPPPEPALLLQPVRAAPERAPLIVDAAVSLGTASAWEQGAGYRRGLRDALASLPDGDPSQLVRLGVDHALEDAEQVVRRAEAGALLGELGSSAEAIAPPTLDAAPIAQAEALAQDSDEQGALDQAQREQAAVAALEEAKRREAAERDQALKTLLKRQRELAEERLKLTETLGARLETERTLNREIEASWTTFVEPRREQLEALSASLTDAQRRARVDPLFDELIAKRRQLWDQTDITRLALFQARERLTEALAAEALAEEALEAFLATEAPDTEVRRQREKVARDALAVARSKRESLGLIRDALLARLTLQRAELDDVSAVIRGALPRVSDQARSQFYDLFSPQNWRDALHLFGDKIEGWQERFAQRWEAASSMKERLANVLLWVLAMLPRLFLFVIATFMLRFVPTLLRRGLDAALTRPTVRRKPTVAIKLYEMVRAAAKPALFIWVASIVFDHVLKTFPEAAPLWGAVEAAFVFWIVDRVSRTLFLARSKREARGAVDSGGIDDLTPAEAQMADLFLLDETLAERAVRSVRIIVALVISWLWALDLLYALVGYSVLSFLVRWVLIGAIFAVVFWALSAWRGEIVALFGKLTDDRAPGAKQFVDRHASRFYGLAVVAVAAVVLLGAELFRLGRRYLVGTQAFKRWSNFLFATRAELQARYEEQHTEKASFSAEAERALMAIDPNEEAIISRPELDALLALHARFEQDARVVSGSVALVSERGLGRSWLLKRAASALPEAHMVRAPRAATAAEALAFALQCAGLSEGGEEPEARSLDEVIAALAEAPRRVILIEDIERMFTRTVGGYGGLLALCRVISQTDRQHFWVVGCSSQAWRFLQRVYDVRQSFAHLFELPRWSGAELKVMLMARTRAAGLNVGFEAAEGTNSSEIVKTEEGYFRYLEEFCDGNPAASLHYWRESLCVPREESELDAAVQLFDRRHAAALEALSDRQRFILNAIVQHGDPCPEQLAEATNIPLDRVATLLDVLEDLGIVRQASEEIRLAERWAPLVARHLTVSNLTVT